MSDYNNGALPDPCLRLDYGFGEEWASVELGDGTGYVRLADYEKLESENAKLRDTTYAWRTVDRLSCENAKLRELVQGLWFAAQYLGMSPDGATGSGFARQMHELGIEVD